MKKLRKIKYDLIKTNFDNYINEKQILVAKINLSKYLNEEDVENEFKINPFKENKSYNSPTLANNSDLNFINQISNISSLKPKKNNSYDNKDD